MGSDERFPLLRPQNPNAAPVSGADATVLSPRQGRRLVWDLFAGILTPPGPRADGDIQAFERTARLASSFILKPRPGPQVPFRVVTELSKGSFTRTGYSLTPLPGGVKEIPLVAANQTSGEPDGDVDASYFPQSPRGRQSSHASWRVLWDVPWPHASKVTAPSAQGNSLPASCPPCHPVRAAFRR